MAVLTATGINFSDGTSANSRANLSFPSGTVTLFYRQSAPSGWSSVAANDRILRIVSGSGGNAVGNNAFSSILATRNVSVNVPVSISFSVAAVTLDTNMIPAHAHPANNGGNSNSNPGGGVTVVNPGSSTGNVNNGGGGAHSHPINYAANGPFNTNIDMRVQYNDVIMCSWGG